MPSVSAIALADARLLVLVSSAIVNFPEHTSRVFTPLKAISQNKNVSFTSSTNLLRLLLVYASPIAHSAEEIAALSSSLLHAERSNDLSESDVIEDIENLLSWLEKDLNISVEDPEDAIVHTANDILVDLATKSHSLSLTIDEDSTDPRAALFTFVRAKCLQLGSYYDNVTSFAESFESLRNYAPFKAWLQGVILPYHYYHQNYALPTDRSTPANDYLSLKNYVDVFKYLVSPLESGSESMGPKLQPRAYFSNVILPLAAYNSNDLAPLTAWIFKHHPGCDTIADFEFWDELLRTVLSFHNQSGQRFPPTSSEDLIHHYIYACLYFGLCRCEKMTNLMQSKIQTKIRDTLLYLTDIIGPMDVRIKIENENLEFLEYSTLEEFATAPPGVVKSIVDRALPESLSYILQVFSTCCSLHALNELTVRKFFFLKSQADSKPQWFHKEVMHLFSRADTQDYDHVLSSLAVFSEAFLSQNIETVKEVDQLIFDNFLRTENFTKAIEYFHGLPEERKLSTEAAFHMVNRKFWELFDSASNLDDRIGKLKLATNCLDILDTISRKDGLSDENKKVVIKTKHLLKAIHSLKNFKLVLVRNSPVTPKQILDRITSSSSEEKYPQFTVISSILEQNPKSYLAHERLHKIVNDLGIFADFDLSIVSFPRIQSACVESALIDGNFDFAYKQTKALITYCIETKNTECFNDIWLMFYQVGKYISSEWFGDYDAKIQDEKIGVLFKQREILSLAIKYTKPNTFTTDNSRLLVGQFRHVNQEIQKWHEEAGLHRSDEVQDAFQSTQKQIQENITGLLNEASHSKNQASEKISNLFVSGLGWAIGAKR